MDEYVIEYKKIVPKLVAIKNYKLSYEKELNNINNIIKFCDEELQMPLLNIEHLYMFAFDSKDNCLGCMLINTGTETATKTDNKKIITFLLLSGASQFFLIHNHPDGNSKPSDQDKITEGSIKVLAEMFNLNYIGGATIGDISWSVISTDKEYYY